MKLSPGLAKYVRDWRTLPADAALAWRVDGWRAAGDEVAFRSVHRIARAGHLVIFAQSLDRIPPLAPPPGVTIAPLGEVDWLPLGTLVGSRQLDRWRRLVASGCVCLVAWRGSRPIGYTWATRRLQPEVTLCPVPLPSHAAYLWDLYVVPAERSNGVGSALSVARLALAREWGFREGWRMIAPDNHASLATLRRSAASSRVIGEIRYLKLLRHLSARFRPAPEPA